MGYYVRNINNNLKKDEISSSLLGFSLLLVLTGRKRGFWGENYEIWENFEGFLAEICLKGNSEISRCLEGPVKSQKSRSNVAFDQSIQ